MSTRSVLTTAYSLKGLPEIGSDNHGQMVEIMLRFAGSVPGQPWCAAFVAWCGWHGEFDYMLGKSYWPLPLTASCLSLYHFAESKQILTKVPKPGNVILVWHPEMNRVGHAAFLVTPESPATSAWRTVEGNSNEDGSRNGWEVVEKRGPKARVIHPNDWIVDWQALLPQQAVA